MRLVKKITEKLFTQHLSFKDKQMYSERFKLVPAVCVLLRKANKFLLIKRQNTGYQDGKYGLLGGGVDGNETILKAAIREAKEEVGVTLQEKDLDVIHVLHERYKNKYEAIVFLVEAKHWTGEPKIAEPEKCSGITWSDIDNIHELTMPTLKHAIKQINENKFYSEVGWE